MELLEGRPAHGSSRLRHQGVWARCWATADVPRAIPENCVEDNEALTVQGPVPGRAPPGSYLFSAALPWALLLPPHARTCCWLKGTVNTYIPELNELSLALGLSGCCGFCCVFSVPSTVQGSSSVTS